MKTYFITGRKCTSVYHLRVEASNSQGLEHTNNVNNKLAAEQNHHLNNINNNTTKEKVKLTQSQPNGTKSLPVLGTFVTGKGRYPSTTSLSGSEDSKEGRVIMNKLHRFLRQRSAPATGSPPPVISITKNDDEGHNKNNVTLKVPLLSKSEGKQILKKIFQ